MSVSWGAEPDGCWLGRFQVGDRLPLSVMTLVDAQTTAWPAAANGPPTFTIYANDGTVVESGRLPAHDPKQQTGLFAKPHLLGSSYSAGNYTVRYTYTVSSQTHAKCDAFEIVAGGDADGMVVAVSHFDRPETRHLMYETEAGAIKTGHNPRPANL